VFASFDAAQLDRLVALADELRDEASLHCVDHPRRE
jgi:hypothetical protein